MESFLFVIPLALACAVSALATPPVVRLARAWGIVDHPTEGAVNRRPDIPLLGGLAVACGFCLGLPLALQLLVPDDVSTIQLRGLALGGGLMLAVGILDDRFGLNAWQKFGGQIVAAAIAIDSGFVLGHITEPITRDGFVMPIWLAWPVTVLWIVGVTNAINLIDGLDGLAVGVAAIIGITLTLIAGVGGQQVGVCIGIALVGALMGFLPYNFSPARIFLGDTGSLPAGYILALLALEGYRQISVLTFVVPLLALAVPILDTALSVVRRVRLGAPLFAADRLHMHHRLLASEGSPRAAVLQFYFLTAAFCLIALSFTQLSGYTAGIFLAAVAVLTLRLLLNVELCNIYPGYGFVHCSGQNTETK